MISAYPARNELRFLTVTLDELFVKRSDLRSGLKPLKRSF